MATIDIYKGIKTVFNKRIWIAAWNDEYNPDTPLGEDGASPLLTREDFKLLSRCKQSNEEVATESDPEDAFDEKTLSRVRNENLMVTTRTTTYDMERTSVLYLNIYNGIKDPMSDETLAAIESGKPVQFMATNNPKVKVAMKEETFDDNKNLLFTKYSFGYLVATGTQTSDGKIVRPQIQYEIEASVHTQIVYSSYFTSGATA